MKQSAADIAVIGGGHAGVEAARAAAALGLDTLLITHRLDRIGEMSCNPAIGGIGKAHLVREIDALDGCMGVAGDEAAIQYRLLNRSRGPAVQGPRVQADRARYRAAIQRLVGETPRLGLLEAGVDDLVFSGGRVAGLLLDNGGHIAVRAVVLTAGTFLNGVIHVGGESRSGGRVGDAPALGLARALERLDLPLGRLKTGTPPRLKADSIDWERLERQPTDSDPVFLSFLTTKIAAPQIACAITHTNARTHRIVAERLHESASYSDRLAARGPRYCPALEDKIVRFPDKTGHQVFLEPEGLDSDLVYPNGLSTSLAAETQEAFLRTVVGLEEVEIAQHGYAIEYDYVDPRALTPALALKGREGLFLAGQVNGTTGYEEAAAQGLVAGLNAALHILGRAPAYFPRAESYIGVMIDDLVTRGVTEPYRMFTSRAEHRLALRPDNADQRLTPRGEALGLASDARMTAFRAKKKGIDAGTAALQAVSFTPDEARHMGLAVNRDGRRRNGLDLLALDGADRAVLLKLASELAALPVETQEQIIRQARYRPYVAQQAAQVAQMARDEDALIPETFDYAAVAGLSAELRQRLDQVRPLSLGQASRIEGVTPAAMLLLAARLRKLGRVAAA